MLLKVGGKGLFVKEFEVVLVDGWVDFVVYLLKDVLMVLFDGFVFVVIMECEDLCDVFVLNDYVLFDVLLVGVVVGMLSLCCEVMLCLCYLYFEVLLLCGNFDMCLVKFDCGDYVVIIFVVVGLKCFGFEVWICVLFDVEVSLLVVG